ncbi:MAG: metallophosphoesterase [Thermomicrobiales bacterium]|nr:metallophosphoesterase [Thermomicrobiales bacterium]
MSPASVAVRPSFVIGDIHGQFDKLVALLRGAALIDRNGRWTGADSALWLIGDLVDRGPAGNQVINMAMRLEQEARAAGGRAVTLLGNHDILLLAAYHFGDWPGKRRTESFADIWLRNGGKLADLALLDDRQVNWLSSLPAMAHHGPYLLTHGDTMLYTRYGQSVAQVNEHFHDLLHDLDPVAWYRLLSEFSEHRVFTGATGPTRAREFLAHFGGQVVVHGHTPVSRITGLPAEDVTAPLIYADDLCVDVDGGMYLGGPGFVYRLP